MTPRRRETFELVTLGHIRSHGCRDLLIYCESGHCYHSTVMNADWLPDETPVRWALLAHGVHVLRLDRRRRAAGLVAAHGASPDLAVTRMSARRAD